MVALGSIETLIRRVRLAEAIDTKDVVSKDEFKRMWIIKKEQRWKGKRLFGQFLERCQSQ